MPPEPYRIACATPVHDLVYSLLDTADVVRRYLPTNYGVVIAGAEVLIVGRDTASWRLEAHVILKLASVGITAEVIL